MGRRCPADKRDSAKANSRLTLHRYKTAMVADSRRSELLWWSTVIAVALAGCLLRVAAAQGGLWTDEAWSMIYAAEARDPIGVFLRINHDNNHHLYSLWLQAIGMQAPPWLARVPAIICGTAGVIVAALLLRPRSRAAGIIAAVLFAFSPAMVTFGAEARGYAPMLLAALVMLCLVTTAVEHGPGRATPWLVAAVSVLGMLSQMTMAAPIGLVSLWVYLERRAAAGPKAGLRDAMRLLGPALAATAGVILFVFAAAAASRTGMRLGGYVPFEWSDYALALDDLSGWTLGVSGAAPWLGPLLLAVVAAVVMVRPPAWLGTRARLYGLLILGVPIAVGLVHPGNAAFSRYYLTSSLGLLLLASEWIGRGLEVRGSFRVASAMTLATVLSVAAWHDFGIVKSQRGHPEDALAMMSRSSPVGAAVVVEPQRLAGIVTVAAAEEDYRVRIVDGCRPAQFVLASRARFAAAPPTIERCGATLHLIGGNSGTALSGDYWTLYGAEEDSGRLQTAGPPVSGRVPGGPVGSLSGRAGVAQG